MVMIDVDGMYWIEFFFFKQKTAYEMRISDWSSDVCSSDLKVDARGRAAGIAATHHAIERADMAGHELLALFVGTADRIGIGDDRHDLRLLAAQQIAGAREHPGFGLTAGVVDHHQAPEVAGAARSGKARWLGDAGTSPRGGADANNHHPASTAHA